jgi:hypothetical protein
MGFERATALLKVFAPKEVHAMDQAGLETCAGE